MTFLPPQPHRPRASVQVVNLLPVAMGVIAVLLALSFFGKVASALFAITLAIILATALNPAARFLERWLPHPAAGLLTVGTITPVTSTSTTPPAPSRRVQPGHQQRTGIR